MVVFERKFVDTKTAHARLVDGVPQSEAEAEEAPADLQNSANCRGDAEQKFQLERDKANVAQKPCICPSETAKKTFCKLTEMPSQAQLL